KFDRLSDTLIGIAGGVFQREEERPVVCSEKLVESTVIQAKSGVLIPLVNWSAGPVKGLKVRVTIDVPSAKVELASGRPVKAAKEGGTAVCTLDHDVADDL